MSTTDKRLLLFRVSLPLVAVILCLGFAYQAFQSRYGARVEKFEFYSQADRADDRPGLIASVWEHKLPRAETLGGSVVAVTLPAPPTPAASE